MQIVGDGALCKLTIHSSHINNMKYHTLLLSLMCAVPSVQTVTASDISADGDSALYRFVELVAPEQISLPVVINENGGVNAHPAVIGALAIGHRNKLVEFKGKNYFFSHIGGLGGGSGSRSVIAEPLEYNDDGTIRPIHASAAGISTLYSALDNKHNPILPGFHADPEIIYSNKTGKYYIYSTTDGTPGWGGHYFRVYSSHNLADWTDEGIMLDVKGQQVPWAVGNAWAPAIIERKEDDAERSIGRTVSHMIVGRAGIVNRPHEVIDAIAEEHIRSLTEFMLSILLLWTSRLSAAASRLMSTYSMTRLRENITFIGATVIWPALSLTMI